jgi:hypothetical protein
MIFADVLKAVERFSSEELQALREYLAARQQQLELRAGTVDMEALLNALDEIRVWLTDEEFAEIERAMNEE